MPLNQDALSGQRPEATATVVKNVHSMAASVLPRLHQCHCVSIGSGQASHSGVYTTATHLPWFAGICYRRMTGKVIQVAPRPVFGVNSDGSCVVDRKLKNLTVDLILEKCRGDSRCN